MTENRAKSIDDCLKELRGHRDEYLKRSTPWRIVNRAVHLIEELKAYRAIGTVKGYERAIEISNENYCLYREYKAKVQQFEAIGTIEELQALKEKNEPKRVKQLKMNGELLGQCKVCKRDVFIIEKYCAICGQALDWSK